MFANVSMGILASLGAFIVPVIASVGFSEVCANEVWTQGVAAALALAAWYGRYRVGDVTWYGARKS